MVMMVMVMVMMMMMNDDVYFGAEIIIDIHRDPKNTAFLTRSDDFSCFTKYCTNINVRCAGKYCLRFDKITTKLRMGLFSNRVFSTAWSMRN